MSPKIFLKIAVNSSPVAAIVSGGGVPEVEFVKLRADGVGEASIWCSSCLSLYKLSNVRSNILV